MLSDVVKLIPQIFEAIAELQVELCLVKVEKLDPCIRPLFVNPLTNVIYVVTILWLKHQIGIPTYYYVYLRQKVLMAIEGNMPKFSIVWPDCFFLLYSDGKKGSGHVRLAKIMFDISAQCY